MHVNGEFVLEICHTNTMLLDKSSIEIDLHVVKYLFSFFCELHEYKSYLANYIGQLYDNFMVGYDFDSFRC
jgi:hypothetical protein